MLAIEIPLEFGLFVWIAVVAYLLQRNCFQT